MKEEYVSFELAKKLREKGYPQSRSGKYDMKGACYFEDGRFYEDGCIANVEDCFTAPTIPQVLTWLRKEKNIYVVVFIDDDSDDPVTYNIFEGTDCLYHHHGEYFTLSEWNSCEIAGIEYVLNNLI